MEYSNKEWSEAKRLFCRGLSYEKTARALQMERGELQKRGTQEDWLAARRQARQGEQATRQREADRDNGGLKRIADSIIKRTLLLCENAETVKDMKDLTGILKDLAAVNRSLQNEEEQTKEQQPEPQQIRFIVEGDYDGD